MIAKFQNFHKTDIPYITIDVQGKPLNMIVDTGCGMSLITKDAVKGLSVEKSPRKVGLSALTSDAIVPDVVVIPITIDGKQVCEDFAVYDEDDIANFQKLYGITIHGLLGNEFFQITDCVIDYSTHTVKME